MTKGRIPDRWEEYEPVGKVIAGTRFIAFKVPLNPVLSRFLPDDVKRFLPEDLPASIREQERELGIVIDLTNTTRYYNKEDILNQGIEYQKIFTEGHMVPSRGVQNCFFKAVDDFLSSNEDNDRVIGVHCTHGLNRTGYLVCRYMIDRMNFKADDAIKAFNEARGYDIERQNYLSDLRGELSSDVPSPNKDQRMERKRMAPANERLEDSTEAPHSESKQRCTKDASFTRQSRANDQWSHGHNGSQSGLNSQNYSGKGSYQSRNYHSNYGQNYARSYDQHDYYNNRYDFSRQPRGYYRQGYNAYQNNYASDGSWRKPRGYDQHGYDFASNDFSNHTNFGGAWFQRRGGRAHGQGWGQRDPRPQYGQSSRNNEAGRNDNDRHQRSDSKQWRGNNQS